MKSLLYSFSSCLLAGGLFLAPQSARAEHASERLQEASNVFSEIMATPDKGIPQDLLERAHCVVIVPGVKKAAFIVGGKYGRGFATCRNTAHTGWGAPAAVRIEGGSFGFQIGGSETDVVMLVMNEAGMNKLLGDKFTLDAAASVAAGPVGRTSEAATDAKLTAGILSYSRARGAFAGLSLGGATLRDDKDENEELYGKKLSNKEIIMSSMKAPASAQPLISQLNKFSYTENGTRARTKK